MARRTSRLDATTFAAGEPNLAGASAFVALEVDGNRLGKVVAEIANIFLRERLTGDDCTESVGWTTKNKHNRVRTFKSLFDIDGLLCARLEVWDAALGLAKGHCALG